MSRILSSLLLATIATSRASPVGVATARFQEAQSKEASNDFFGLQTIQLTEATLPVAALVSQPRARTAHAVASHRRLDAVTSSANASSAPPANPSAEPTPIITTTADTPAVTPAGPATPAASAATPPPTPPSTGCATTGSFCDFSH